MAKKWQFTVGNVVKLCAVFITAVTMTLGIVKVNQMEDEQQEYYQTHQQDIQPPTSSPSHPTIQAASSPQSTPMTSNSAH